MCIKKTFTYEFVYLLIIILIMTSAFIFLLTGCELIPDSPTPARPTDGMTASQKIEYYQCWYCFDSHGYCCKNKVPEYDQNIFDCTNAKLFSPKCSTPNCQL